LFRRYIVFSKHFIYAHRTGLMAEKADALFGDIAATIEKGKKYRGYG
jgi:hypothetical protein